MIAYRKDSRYNKVFAKADLQLHRPCDEVEDVLETWIEESYREIIDLTEFLDSSRVKRID